MCTMCVIHRSLPYNPICSHGYCYSLLLKFHNKMIVFNKNCLKCFQTQTWLCMVYQLCRHNWTILNVQCVCQKCRTHYSTYVLSWILKHFIDAITHNLEISLICSTAFPAKNILNSFCQMSDNIYGQSKISPYISYGKP